MLIENPRIDWDTYFMSLAYLTALRSPDPSTKLGAVIVSPERVIVGCGYNGYPRGAEFNEGHEALEIATKTPYMVHAEVNAIINANSKTRGTRLYVPWLPCHECAKLIVSAGIEEVVYHVQGQKAYDDSCRAVGREVTWSDSNRIALEIFCASNVTVTPLDTTDLEITRAWFNKTWWSVV